MLELLLLAIAILIYFPCLNGPPIYDDQQLFQNQNWAWAAMKKPTLRWLPMLTLGATFNHVKPKYVIQALHLTNAVFHWMNALLVKQVALHDMDPISASLAMVAFLVHPLAAPAVAPIATRAMVMASGFTLLGVIAIQNGFAILALPCILGAVFCREDAVSIVPMMLILTAMDSGWMALVLIVLLGLTAHFIPIRKTWTWLMARKGDRGMLAAGIVDSFKQPMYTLTAMTENLIRWPMWAIGLGMNPDPRIEPVSLRSWRLRFARLILSIAVAILIFGSPVAQLAILLIGCSPWAATWFIQLPDGIAEYRAYITVIGPALFAGFLPLPLAITLCLWWAVLAVRRAYQQRHPVPYWLAAWNEKKPKFRVALNIGAAFQQVNDMENARKWHLKALELQPANGIALANMGLWHEGLSRVERHLLSQSYVQTGRIDPKEADQRNQQSLAHLAHAYQFMEQAEQVCPQDPIVKQYAQMVRDSAERMGLRRQAPKIHLVDPAG